MDGDIANVNDNLIEEKHHVQQELCKNRPAYRQGRNLTSIKVYTINSESQHLFIYGVPSINLRPELKNLVMKYGQVTSLHVVETHKTEVFTECYHVTYQRIQSARIAKRFIDNRSFYGGLLHVCYAPEYESIAETREKLSQRKYEVLSRLNGNTPTSGMKSNDKRSYSAMSDDPMLFSKKCNNKNTVPKKELEENKIIEYGPSLSDFYKQKQLLNYQKVEEVPSTSKKLVPSVVLKNKVQEKRIVFKKNVLQ